MAQADYVTTAIRVLITGTSAKSSTNPVQAAYAEFVAALAGPRPIPVDADAVDLEERADHLKQVLNALSVHATAIVNDTAHNIRAGLMFARSTPSFPTLHPTRPAPLQHAVERMAWRVA